MSDSRERTDRLLDEIDELVDVSLSRGDQSGSWQGERYDRCPKCDEAWHFLPITRTMYQMRLGSYAQDEFGQGIVDPDYKYQEDTSPILCPGSEWLGPPIGNREWGWYLRKSGRRPAPRHRQQSTPGRSSRVERGYRAPRWRFRGPYKGWDITLHHDAEFAPSRSGRLPEVIGVTLTAEFRLLNPIPIPDGTWLLRNNEWIEREEWHSLDGMLRHVAYMKPIKFQYYELEVFHEGPNPNPSGDPTWVEFKTTFPIDIIPWWMDHWERAGEQSWSFDDTQARVAVTAQPADMVIIDEAYEMRTDELMRRIEEIPSFREAMNDTIIEMSNASGLTPEQVERLLTDEADSSGQGGTT